MRFGPLRRLAATCALAFAVVLSTASLADAASNSLGGITTTTTATSTLPAPAGVTTATSTNANTATGAGGLTTIEVIGIAVATIAVFGAIFYAIRSDARSHTPSGDAGLDYNRERGTVTPRADRIRRSRAKSKAARRARRTGR